jgi:hypothetical protein
MKLMRQAGTGTEVGCEARSGGDKTPASITTAAASSLCLPGTEKLVLPTLSCKPWRNRGGQLR